MNQLGIICQLEEPDSSLSHLLEKENYAYSTIQQEAQIATIDGLLIVIKREADVLASVEWLVRAKDVSNLFVWLHIDCSIPYVKEVFMELGANGVSVQKDGLTYVCLVFRNYFMRLTQMMTQQIEEQVAVLAPLNRSIIVNDHEVAFTNKEYRILSVLYEHKNKVVTYDILIEQLWPSQQKKKVVQLANVINHLREKLQEIPSVYIITVRSVGYQLKEKSLSSNEIN